MIIQAIRSLIFYLLFFIQTTILALIIGTAAKFAKGRFTFGWVLAKFWANSTLFLLHWIVGIKTEITGLENIPEGGCIIAAKHQSDWDIFAIFPHAGRPAFIAKKELMDIPFFGWSMRAFDSIPVDRKIGSGTIPEMMKGARRAIAAGCRIIIYPEGTRKAPLAETNYRFGTAKLYSNLNVPVVPVALNSGLFWGRNSLVLWPGTARARFLPPIAPGLTQSQMQKQMIEAIEVATNQLIIESVDAGLTRPITPEFRARFDALKNKNPNE